jgi:hypothetical protein
VLERAAGSGNGIVRQRAHEDDISTIFDHNDACAPPSAHARR